MSLQAGYIHQPRAHYAFAGFSAVKAFIHRAKGHSVCIGLVVPIKTQPSHRVDGFPVKKSSAFARLRATRHGHEKEKPGL
jgi:hypothetical protein